MTKASYLICLRGQQRFVSFVQLCNAGRAFPYSVRLTQSTATLRVLLLFLNVSLRDAQRAGLFACSLLTLAYPRFLLVPADKRTRCALKHGTRHSTRCCLLCCASVAVVAGEVDVLGVGQSATGVLTIVRPPRVTTVRS